MGQGDTGTASGRPAALGNSEAGSVRAPAGGKAGADALRCDERFGGRRADRGSSPFRTRVSAVRRNQPSFDSEEHRDEEGSRRRSEEHTSELQSHLNLVCRLLLEKKKTQSATP